MQIFGASKGFVESANHALEEMAFTPNHNLFKSLDREAANQISTCDYENSTEWGKQVRNKKQYSTCYCYKIPPNTKQDIWFLSHFRKKRKKHVLKSLFLRYLT